MDSFQDAREIDIDLLHAVETGDVGEVEFILAEGGDPHALISAKHSAHKPSIGQLVYTAITPLFRALWSSKRPDGEDIISALIEQPRVLDCVPPAYIAAAGLCELEQANAPYSALADAEAGAGVITILQALTSLRSLEPAMRLYTVSAIRAQLCDAATPSLFEAGAQARTSIGVYLSSGGHRHLTKGCCLLQYGALMSDDDFAAMLGQTKSWVTPYGEPVPMPLPVYAIASTDLDDKKTAMAIETFLRAGLRVGYEFAGLNLLHWAAFSNKKLTAHALLDAGAPVDAMSASFTILGAHPRTALQIATDRNGKETAQLIAAFSAREAITKVASIGRLQ